MPSEEWHRLERDYQSQYDRMNWHLRHDDPVKAAYFRGRMDAARGVLESYERGCQY